MVKVPIMTSCEDSRSYRPAKEYMLFWLLPELEAPPLPRPLLAENSDLCHEGHTEVDDPGV